MKRLPLIVLSCLLAAISLGQSQTISWSSKLSANLLKFWKTNYTLGGSTLNSSFLLAAYPTITVNNAAAENWSSWDALLVDVTNSSGDPMQVYFRVDDSMTSNGGSPGSRTGWAIVPANSTKTIAFPLRLRPQDYGMKALPGLQGSEWLTMNNGIIDLTRIWRWMIYIQNPNGPTRNMAFTNPRLVVANADLSNMIDNLGQYNRVSWFNKVTSLADLLVKDNVERLDLIANPSVSGFDARGAWEAGPQKGPNPRFYTANFNGKWWFVSPEGRLFLSFGMAAAGSHHETVTPGREYMFSWLPSGGDPLAQFYGTAPNGNQTFQFYPANLYRKYGETWFNNSRDRTLARMKSWGFNTLGSWSDEQYARTGSMPYTVQVDVKGTYQTLSVDPTRKSLGDPFDPAFRTAVQACIADAPSYAINDPMCVGWFIDNEPTMLGGASTEEAGRYGFAYAAMKKDMGSFAKQRLISQLKGKYGTIAALNTAWATNFTAWSTLEAPITIPEPSSATRKLDFQAFCQSGFREYFRVIKESLRAVDTSVLYMGCRFFRYSPETLNAINSYANVISFNVYADQVGTRFDDVNLPGVTKPIIIGEFHFGATDAGMFHPGLFQVGSQAERGTAFTRYVRSVVDHPKVVGCHWFSYMDQPVTGREVDGENYNIGFVSVGDVPYAPLVSAARSVHAEAYARRYGN